MGPGSVVVLLSVVHTLRGRISPKPRNHGSIVCTYFYMFRCKSFPEVHTCTYICIYIYICVSMCICILCTCMYTYIYKWEKVYASIGIHTYIWMNTWVSMCVCIYDMCICTYVHTYI